jgi:DNA-binding transcriptional LysR family regulator
MSGGMPMSRRHEERNIPIGLLRTAVAIADAGSYTKAARELGFSQPAVSLQVKRLQRIFVGEIFDVSKGSPRLTAYGETIIDGARRILSINDELIALANLETHREDQIVVGIHNSIATPTLSGLFKRLASRQKNQVNFRNLTTEQLLKGLEGGYIDVALMTGPSRTPPVTILEWWEPLFWVKGPEFRFDPTKPIPLVSFPGGFSDRWATAALKRAGLRYWITFVSAQINSRIAAVRGGIGIMVLSPRTVTDEVVIADDPGLPELPRVRCGIYLRHGLEMSRVEQVIKSLEAELRPREQYEIIPPPKHRGS